MKFQSATALLAGMLVLAAPAFAADAPLELKWSELSPLITGYTLQFAGIGGYAAVKSADAGRSGGGAVAIFFAITGALAVGGYYAGRALDRKTTTIHVTP